MINNNTAPYGAALLRIALGVLFLAHVGFKLFVFTVLGFVGFFESMGLPSAIAYPIIALELLGGIALVLGIYASWVAIPLAIEMLGVAFVHAPNGFSFANPDGGWEYPALWFIALVVVFLLGDGAWALLPARR
jgi:putative oxidoreductase